MFQRYLTDFLETIVIANKKLLRHFFLKVPLYLENCLCNFKFGKIRTPSGSSLILPITCFYNVIIEP